MDKSKIEEILASYKINELLKKDEKSKECNILLCVLAVIGAVLIIAGIAFAVYKFVAPVDDDYDDYDDDEELDDDFFDDEDEE